MKKFYRKFKRLLKQVKKIFTKEEYSLLLKSIFNLLKNNKSIRQNPKLEYAKSLRGYIYSVDFGFTVGSVLRDRHYCVVLNTQGKTAIVIPLTSKPPKNTNISKVNLGIIKGISKNNTQSYALVNQITTVSRSLLISPRINKKIVYARLNANQMNDIEKELQNILFKTLV